MMKTSLSKHEKMMASKSWRMANASNSREEQNLQKEKQRLMKQYEAETCQLKVVFHSNFKKIQFMLYLSYLSTIGEITSN